MTNHQCPKKDSGIDQSALKNREKAVMVDALKQKYPLPSPSEKVACDIVLSVAYGGKFIVKMTERGYNKFRRQICFNHGIDIEEYNAEMAKIFGTGYRKCAGLIQM